MRKGRYIELNCNDCGHIDKYHINDLRAEKSNLALLSGLLIFAIGTPLVFFFLWDKIFSTSNIYFMIVIVGIILIPIKIYGLIQKDERKKINHFNRYKIKK